MAKKITKKSKRELEDEDTGPLDQEDIDDADATLHCGLVDAVNADLDDDEFDTEVAAPFYLRQIYAQLKRVADSLEKLANASDSKL